LLCLCAASAAAATTAVDIPHDVVAWRARFVAAHRGSDGHRGYYVEDTARFVVGRIEQRGVGALLFTLEGQHASGDWQQYVAVFWSSAGHYLYCCSQRVGAAGTRLLDDIAIDDDRIRLRGNAFSAGDAPCCPSRPVSVRLALARHRLSELAGR
jgi:hypothetical protein